MPTKKRQQGLSLIETTFVLTIGSFGALALAQYQVEKVRATVIKDEALQYKAIADAAARYTERNLIVLMCQLNTGSPADATDCRGGQPAQISDVAGNTVAIPAHITATTPDLAFLRATGDLKTPTSGPLRFTGMPTITITRDSACTPSLNSGMSCNLTLLIESGHPIYARGHDAVDPTDPEASVDLIAASALIQHIGARSGLRTTFTSPGVAGPYSGLQGAWQFTPSTTTCAQLGCLAILQKTSTSALRNVATTGNANQQMRGDIQLWQTRVSELAVNTAIGYGGARDADIVDYRNAGTSTFTDKLTVADNLKVDRIETGNLSVSGSIASNGPDASGPGARSTANTISEARNIQFDAIHVSEVSPNQNRFQGSFKSVNGGDVRNLRCDKNSNPAACNMAPVDQDVTCLVHPGDALFGC